MQDLKPCWEMMECKVKEECPAYPRNGSVCFMVEGTLCRGEKQGSYVDKIKQCRKLCKHYTYITEHHCV